MRKRIDALTKSVLGKYVLLKYTIYQFFVGSRKVAKEAAERFLCFLKGGGKSYGAWHREVV